MTIFIRFTTVEINSNICFRGRSRKTLKYPVRSLSLLPVYKVKGKQPIPGSLPEIFWQ
jgi:hypothetical protein